MLGGSHSEFLHALGWAVLNSFWQTGLLWSLISGMAAAFRFTSSQRYVASVGGLVSAFAWFVVSFLRYESGSTNDNSTVPIALRLPGNFVETGLLTASVVYLFLLTVPTIRFAKSLRLVQLIRNHQTIKPSVNYRLFVQKISFRLGIRSHVKLFLSASATSPFTIGYIKPIILLPLAAVNHLSQSQIEAVLLHELSHIRRRDYFVNLFVSAVHTLLYFNPFARLFIESIEAERENCCDEQVLQFGYDPVDYASALLQLQTVAAQRPAFALAAAGRNHLRLRIEKIVGMETKPSFRLRQVVPAGAALLGIFAFNSVLFFTDKKSDAAIAYTSNTVVQPWPFATEPHKKTKALSPQRLNPMVPNVAAASPAGSVTVKVFNLLVPAPIETETSPINFHSVALDDIDVSLTPEEKQEIANTVATTKKVASTLQWNEIENSIGDVMRPEEKALAKLDYLHQLEKVNWDNVEKNLKAHYEQLDWQAINQNVAQAMRLMEVDSLQRIYGQALKEVETLHKDLQRKAKLSRLALPDESVQQVEAARNVLKQTLDSLKKSSPKKAVRL